MVADFINALNHSIISPLWPVWVRALLGSHVGQAKLCLRVSGVFFWGTPVFVPPTVFLLTPAEYKTTTVRYNNLELPVIILTEKQHSQINKKNKQDKKYQSPHEADFMLV